MTGIVGDRPFRQRYELAAVAYRQPHAVPDCALRGVEPQIGGTPVAWHDVGQITVTPRVAEGALELAQHQHERTNDKDQPPQSAFAPAPALVAVEAHGDPCLPGAGCSLIRGDNRAAMRALYPSLEGRVDLVYLDPPFGTGGSFALTERAGGEDDVPAYSDRWGADLGEYLSTMLDQLTLARALLSEKGALFLHCDWHLGHYLRCLLDEVFGDRDAPDFPLGLEDQRGHAAGLEVREELLVDPEQPPRRPGEIDVDRRRLRRPNLRLAPRLGDRGLQLGRHPLELLELRLDLAELIDQAVLGEMGPA